MSYYFTNDDSLKSEIKKIDVVIDNLPFSFWTDNGVFSKKGLDFGTRTLLENLTDIKGRVLDIGCGYGPIGIYIAKKYDVTVDMTDVNRRSLALASENAKLNEVTVNPFYSDLYDNIHGKYDFIVTNPPVRVGKKVLYQLLFEAKDHLNENGQLWLVINKDQGAKSLLKDLNKEYKATVVCKNKGFFIIRAINDWHVDNILVKL